MSLEPNVLKGEHLQPEFHAINPFGKLPALVDGDFIITESAAISLYLADRYGGDRFIPETVEDRSKMHQWISFRH